MTQRWIAQLGVAGALLLLASHPAAAQGRALGGEDETFETATAEAAAALQKTRMRLNVSAVGFGVGATSQAAKELQAIAAAGGGIYAPAERVEELAGALGQAVAGGGAANVPAAAARARAVLLTSGTVRGAAENGGRLDESLAQVLGDQGVAAVPRAELTAALQRLGLDPKTVIPLSRLLELGRSLGVDYVVYTRILSVGRPFNPVGPDERILTSLINVTEVKTGRLIHSFQVGATFTDPSELTPLAPPATTQEAARKLVAGFLTRLPKR